MVESWSYFPNVKAKIHKGRNKKLGPFGDIFGRTIKVVSVLLLSCYKTTGNKSFCQIDRTYVNGKVNGLLNTFFIVKVSII